MGKGVMASIKPYYVFLIIAKAMGWNIEKEKTVEVRKSYPKANDWNKTVKMYCSKDKKSFAMIPKKYQPLMQQFLGKVVGEFVCNKIESFTTDYRANEEQTDSLSVQSCLTWGDLFEYEVNSPCLYAWHVSDLVIYDKPKELSEFKKINRECWYADLGLAKRDCHECKNKGCFVTRPPQSWCYVEAL